MEGSEFSPTAPVVVIGAGQAGFAAAAKLRDLGHSGPLTLVGDEPVAPYQRPPLSKGYLLGDMARERLFLRAPEFYRDRDVMLLTGVGAKEIQARRGVVVLSDGAELPYERLVIATGARPRRLPAAIGGDLDGVLTVRDLADADAMAGAFLPGRRLLVVGGGYIGLEAAASAVKLGLDVTLIEAADRILGRVAAPETADYFRDLHRGHGVDLREGVGLARLAGEKGRVVAAELSDGTRLPVDVVVAGIGVLPNVEIAETAGLAIENGIRVDARCRTSDPAIYAAGDCASFPHEGRRIRLESVGNAIDQAEAAAAAIMGGAAPYVARPWFWSDQYDVKLQIAGLSHGYDRVVIRPGQGAARSVWYFEGDRLRAVDAMNEPKVFMVAKRLLDAGGTVSPAEAADPATDLRALLKASA